MKTESTNIKYVYNLGFPPWCSELTLFGYKFSRVENYKEQVRQLQYLRTRRGGEFEIEANVGTHAITAYVEIPEQEETPVLKWSGDTPTALNDILLLLSIFTRRDVFAVPPHKNETDIDVLRHDSRIYYNGGAILNTSIPYKARPLDNHSPGAECNIGFEEGLNQIYTLMRSEEWQRKYKGGHFLFLAYAAFHPQPVEATFIQCWMIWEHLYSIRDKKEPLPQGIKGEKLTGAYCKVLYILSKYALRNEFSEGDKERIKSLAEIRNVLLHCGRFPDKDRVRAAVLFIQLTEFVIAKILGLIPSNLFNTMGSLEDFLRAKSESQKPEQGSPAPH